jgi:hypothetical protein
VISGGGKSCVLEMKECSVQRHAKSKASLKPGLVYFLAGDGMQNRKPTALLGWSMHVTIFSDRFLEVVGLSLSPTSYKQFCDTLEAQVQEGGNPQFLLWEPVLAPILYPLGFGTPHKACFEALSDSGLVELTGWVNVPPHGVSEEDNYDPMVDNALWTNNLVVNLGITKLAVEISDDNASRCFKVHYISLDAFVGQVHDTHLRLGQNPDIFVEPDVTLWEVLFSVSSKVAGKGLQLTAHIASLMASMVSEVKDGINRDATAAVKHENYAALAVLHSDVMALQRENHQFTIDCASLRKDVQELDNEVILMGRPAVMDPNIVTDWQHLISFFVNHTTPGSGSVGDMLEQALFSGHTSAAHAVSATVPAAIKSMIKDVE